MHAFFIAGKLHGSWQHPRQGKASTISLAPHRSLTGREIRDVDREVRRYLDFTGLNSAINWTDA
jgi:hypothetical protein